MTINTKALRKRWKEFDDYGTVRHCTEVLEVIDALEAARAELALPCSGCGCTSSMTHVEGLAKARAIAFEEAARWHEERGRLISEGLGTPDYAASEAAASVASFRCGVCDFCDGDESFVRCQVVEDKETICALAEALEAARAELAKRYHQITDLMNEADNARAIAFEEATRAVRAESDRICPDPMAQRGGEYVSPPRRCRVLGFASSSSAHNPRPRPARPDSLRGESGGGGEGKGKPGRVPPE